MRIPGVFLAGEFGPIEPNVFRACAIQRPAIDPVPMSDAAGQFLDGIWRRFGSHSAEYLSKLVNGQQPYVEALAKGPRSEISLAAMVAYYGKKASPGDPATVPMMQAVRPRLMRSQTGKPVAVQKWQPPPKISGK